MSEHDEQVRVFDVLRFNEARCPELSFIYAIPNGGHRHPATAGKLKAEGVRKGVPDICIPIPMRSGSRVYCGAYIELKFGKNKLTFEQQQFLACMEKSGYATGTCYGADEVLDFIENYLDIELRGRK